MMVHKGFGALQALSRMSIRPSSLPFDPDYFETLGTLCDAPSTAVHES